MNKRIWIILIAVLISISLIACQPSSPDSSDTSSPVSSAVETETPEAMIGGVLDNPVVRVMSHYPLYEGYKESFATFYNGEIIEILTPVTDYLTKTSTMIMSNDPLDGIVRDSDSAIHFVEFIANDLVVPLDDYIDLSEEVYAPVRNEMEKIKWLDKYYFLGHTLNVNEICYYNEKLFEQVGLETPWELYQKDEWTWEKMLELGEMLGQDTDNDGSIDLYGLAIAAPQILVNTTGIASGEMAGNDIKLNIRDDRFIRAMEMARSLLRDYDYVLKSPTAWAVGFSREKVAMAIAEAWIVDTPEIVSVRDAGNLGLAPLPRDSQNDKYNANGAFIGWVVPRHSQNIEGLVAFNKCHLYERYYSEERKEIIRARREELGILEIMERFDEIQKSPDVIVGWGHAFVFREMWDFFGGEIPWSTYLESVEAQILTRKNEAIQPPQ